MKVSLTQKIYAGNFLLLAAIVGMVVILFRERSRMREIDFEVHDLQSVRNDIHAAHLHITELSLLGESLISQENADTANYRQKRLSTDSLLLALKPRCRQHVRPEQIDTLRHLLADKEMHLFRVVEAIGIQDAADSLLVHHLPKVAERATRIRTVRKRRDNLLGALGAKKTVRVLPSAGELHAFSDSLIAMQQEGTEDMETSADSLYARNLALNARLNHLIKNLDRQVQEAFFQRFALAPSLAAVFRTNHPSGPVGHLVAYLEIDYEVASGYLIYHRVPAGLALPAFRIVAYLLVNDWTFGCNRVRAVES